MTQTEQASVTANFAGEVVLMRWWQAMMLSEQELAKLKIRPAPTVFRAELKRAQTPEAVLMTQGFRALWLSLPDSARERRESMLAWAALAGILSHVKQQDNSRNFAAGLGQVDDKTGKPKVSELRFQQLQGARTPEEFYRRLHRLIKQVNGQSRVSSLAKGVLDWFDEHYGRAPLRADKKVAVRWAMDYYQAAAKGLVKNNN
ncbi:type I-E CRISPR-associated protein Cse2/CasB [Oceanisphaera sp. IT1-181]|uniref:type I-E CRISPR-associated protein Cse2/CasB n=1 Tax=Oceanisphaera sp. IT1-181 TaxID=3081199 RepID=UPI0029CA80FF|nr:type I-E CRISPR-associated protein Cse2/CasB [Oceanisphaera sp. IT1-181]